MGGDDECLANEHEIGTLPGDRSEMISLLHISSPLSAGHDMSRRSVCTPIILDQASLPAARGNQWLFCSSHRYSTVTYIAAASHPTPTGLPAKSPPPAATARYSVSPADLSCRGRPFPTRCRILQSPPIRVRYALRGSSHAALPCGPPGRADSSPPHRSRTPGYGPAPPPSPTRQTNPRLARCPGR